MLIAIGGGQKGSNGEGGKAGFNDWHSADVGSQCRHMRLCAGRKDAG